MAERGQSVQPGFGREERGLLLFLKLASMIGFAARDEPAGAGGVFCR